MSRLSLFDRANDSELTMAGFMVGVLSVQEIRADTVVAGVGAWQGAERHHPRHETAIRGRFAGPDKSVYLIGHGEGAPPPARSDQRGLPRSEPTRRAYASWSSSFQPFLNSSSSSGLSAVSLGCGEGHRGSMPYLEPATHTDLKKS